MASAQQNSMEELSSDAPPMPEETPSDPPRPVLRSSPDRLGMSFDKRLLLGAFSSMVAGFSLGSSHAGNMASLRFRAENAHRLPVSQPGWYLYHKSKNYYKAKEGVSIGLRKGFYVAGWTSIFLIIEESMDVFRGTWRAGRTLTEMEGIDELDMKAMDTSIQRNRDFVSTSLAGMVTGGIWSAWNHFPMVTAARTIRTGFLVGLCYGLGQDAMMWARREFGIADGEVSWIYKGAKNSMDAMTGEGEKEKVEGK